MELKLVFDKYKQMVDIEGAERYLSMQLSGWLEMRPRECEYLREEIKSRLEKVRRHTEAREMCKLETGMAAAPERITF